MTKIILLIILLNVTSCSFQSSQYNFIKDLIKKDNSQYPEKEWKLNWGNKETDLFAINFPDKIIFSDGQINIFFKKQQIYKVSGLLPDDILINVDSTFLKLTYKSNGRVVGNALCENSQPFLGENGYIRYSNICFEEKSGMNFENMIIVNSKNQIIGLKYKIHPNYPSLQLSMRSNDSDI